MEEYGYRHDESHHHRHHPSHVGNQVMALTRVSFRIVDFCVGVFNLCVLCWTVFQLCYLVVTGIYGLFTENRSLRDDPTVNEQESGIRQRDGHGRTYQYDPRSARRRY